MIVVVTIPFVGTIGGVTYNMPAPGTTLDVTEDAARALLSMGVAQEYERKILPVPDVTKKKRLESSQVDPVRRQPMRLNFKRFVTKR